MKEELRRDIELLLANGQKILSRDVSKLMRKHSVGRDKLWKDVKEVQRGQAAADVVVYDAALASSGVHVREEVKEDVVGSLTLEDIKQVAETIYVSRGPVPKAYDLETGAEIDVASILRRSPNPFALLRAKRLWKQQTGDTPSTDTVMAAQKSLMDGTLTLTPDLTTLILSL